MKELAEIKKRTKPHDVLLVIDAMTCQDAVNVAEQFAETANFEVRASEAPERVAVDRPPVGTSSRRPRREEPVTNARPRLKGTRSAFVRPLGVVTVAQL